METEVVLSPFHTIHYTGPINPTVVYSIRGIFIQAMNAGAKEITFLFSSEGGDLNSGLSLYNFLRSFPVKTKIVNFGAVESVATLVFLGADIRSSIDNSTFLFHKVHGNFITQSVDYDRIVEKRELLDCYIETTVDIFESRTDGAERTFDIRTCLKGGSTRMSPPTALSHGIIQFISSISDVRIPGSIHWWVSP